MKSLFDAILQANETVVQVGPLHYKIRRVDSAALKERGVLRLLAIAPRTEAELREAANLARIKDPMERAAAERMAELRRSLKLLDASHREKDQTLMCEILCAGVQAISSDGETWETISLNTKGITNRETAEMDVSMLPPGHASVVGEAVWDLSTGNGRVAATIARFRGASDGAPSVGPNGTPLRETPERAAESVNPGSVDQPDLPDSGGGGGGPADAANRDGIPSLANRVA